MTRNELYGRFLAQIAQFCSEMLADSEDAFHDAYQRALRLGPVEQVNLHLVQWQEGDDLRMGLVAVLCKERAGAAHGATKPYSALTRNLARKYAEAFCETMQKCPCAVNVRKVERLFLPLVEMFEDDIRATGEVGVLLATDHIATYLCRVDQEWAKGLHAAGESARPISQGHARGDQHVK